MTTTSTELGTTTTTTTTKKTGSLLDYVISGPVRAPRRVLLYGTEGVGKSTWAAGAPKAIFLPTEDGLNDIDCQRFPLATAYGHVKQAIETLIHEDHAHKTLVIDSLDWLETLVWDATCAKHSKRSIEDFGYAKGYTYALDLWNELINLLEELRKRKGMTIVLLAHSKIEKVQDPDLEAFDRHSPKLHRIACGRIVEWCDEVFFAAREVFTREAGSKFGEPVHKAISSGHRVIYTSDRPGMVAKMRLHADQETIPLEWAAYQELIDRAHGSEA